MKKSVVVFHAALLAVLAAVLTPVPAGAETGAATHEHQAESFQYTDGYEMISDTKHRCVDHYLCTCGEEVAKVREEDHTIMDDSYSGGWIKKSDTQHERTVYYRCEKCDYSFQKTETGNHNLVKTYEDGREEISKTKHEYKVHYECTGCDAEITKTVQEDHKWTNTDEGYYRSVSATQHAYDLYGYCKECEASREETKKEDHQFDAYGICTRCQYGKQSTVTLSPGKAVKVNPQTWCKVNVKKNGYLVLKSQQETTGISIYNKSKKKYSGINALLEKDNSYTDYLPVPKGVYYLKCRDKATLSYTFKKDPSAKNYSVKKALNMKKNKLYTAVIYPKAKKNTWKRVFKIELKKSQKIRFSGTADVWAVYDKKGEVCGYTVTNFNKKQEDVGDITIEKLPKGIYYIVIKDTWSGKEKGNTTGSYYTVKWK